jgi:hypothetical protein
LFWKCFFFPVFSLFLGFIFPQCPLLIMRPVRHAMPLWRRCTSDSSGGSSRR